MKFTPKEDFRHGRTTFEANNTYDSAKHGLTDDEVRAFHENGWAEVEGMDPAPERKPGARTVRPAKAKHQQKGK